MMIDLRMKYLRIRVFFDAVKVGAEVAVFVGVRCVGGITQFVNEATHSVKAGFVEGFKNVEGGEQKGARAAGGVEDCHRFDGFPEGTQQVGTFAVLNDVLSKLADVQVIGDEVINFMNLAVETILRVLPCIVPAAQQPRAISPLAGHIRKGQGCSIECVSRRC